MFTRHRASAFPHLPRGPLSACGPRASPNARAQVLELESKHEEMMRLAAQLRQDLAKVPARLERPQRTPASTRIADPDTPPKIARLAAPRAGNKAGPRDKHRASGSGADAVSLAGCKAPTAPLFGQSQSR